MLLVLLLGLVPHRAGSVRAGVPSNSATPFRLAEPASAIAANLQQLVPEYMRQERIPGAGVALIRDGGVVWAEGFGLANTITRRPVTPETLFEVASNSKIITAYIALRLVDQGVLALDEPLNSYLSEPWLPASEYRNTITLRHVLSHTSGLGHGTPSRENLFSPGEGYSYSATGFAYLQAVLEEVTGQPLEDLAQEMVFAPLGMSDSSFTSHAGIAPRTANGHVHALAAVLLYAVPFAVLLAIAALVGLLITRIRTGRWRPSRRMAIGVLVAAFLLAFLPPLLLLAAFGLPAMAWLVVLVGLVLATALVLLILAGRALVRRLLPGRQGAQVWLTVLWSVLAIGGLVFLAGRIPNLPVPKWPPPDPSSSGTLRTTTSDLATFLIELSEPRYLSSEMAAQMRASQVTLAPDLSWGLGPGIQHSEDGDALWQWGQHLHFQSVMIIYPESGFGVVVCTNNDLLNAKVAVEIAHRALGGKIEPIMRQAVGLAYNYRPPE